jgi:hypothetical protein
MDVKSVPAGDLAAAQEKLFGLGLIAAVPPEHEYDAHTQSALRTIQTSAGITGSGALDGPMQALLDGWTCGRPLNDEDSVQSPEEFIAEFTFAGGPWPKLDLTYIFDPLPPGLNTADIVGGINQVLQAWSSVTPIRFSQLPAGPDSVADLRFRFDGQIAKPNGTVGPISSFAVASHSNGQISFLPSGGFSMSAAIHEVGHFLELNHSTNRESVMYYSVSTNWTLSADDIEGIQQLYGAPALPVPGWFGFSSSGADVVLADFQNVGPAPPRLDMLVGHIDNATDPDVAYYRVGWDIDSNGHPRSGWGPIVPIGGPLGNDSQGLALAVGNIGGSTPRPDLVMVWIDNPPGANTARYRIAFDLDTSGMNGSVGPDIIIPGPWGFDISGLGAVVTDISGNGQPDMLVAWIDNAPGGNSIYYKIGFDLAANGVASTWSAQLVAASGVGFESGGIGAAITDLRGNGRPDLVLFWVDDSAGENGGRIRVGRDLDGTGIPLRGWDPAQPVLGWWGQSTSGAGAALGDIRGRLRPDLVVLNLDAPPEGNRAYYKVLSPPLPSWNLLHRRQVVGRRTSATAVQGLSPTATTGDLDVVVVAVSSPAPPLSPGLPPTFTVGVWDKTDLNEHQGSDIVEFVFQPGLAARDDSPVAIVSRRAGVADAFWIGTDGIIRTLWSNMLGKPGTPISGPAWALPGTALQNSVPARSGTPTLPPIPPSPLAAASIHEQHLGVFFVGPQDELLWHVWNQATNWPPVRRAARTWRSHVTALTAAA